MLQDASHVSYIVGTIYRPGWDYLEPLLPGGWQGLDNRLFLNAAFWILRTCLLTEIGNTHRRFCRWRDRGVWEKLLDEVIDEPDFEWLMIDSSHIKVHPHAAGAVGGNQEMARTKGG